MEWMAAMKLYNYMDAFEKRTVSGAKLVELDEECLKVRPLLANSVAIRRSNWGAVGLPASLLCMPVNLLSPGNAG